MPSELVDLLIAYETDELDYDQFVDMFQLIYDTRAYTWLQGHYGRTLNNLIANGVINA
jgi:hypothetical protein